MAQRIQRGSGPRSRGSRGGSALARPDAGIRKRSPAPPKVDKDGDLDMGSASTRGQGRGPSRGQGRGAPRAPRGNPFSRATTRGGTGRNTFDTDRIGRASTRDVDTSHASRNSGRNGVRADTILKEVQGRGRRSEEEELKVTGWDKSLAAASNPSGVVDNLISFLKRKAGTHARPVHLRQSRVSDHTLYIWVSKDTVDTVLRLNGYEFTKAPITIERLPPPLTPAQIREKMTAMLSRRYDAQAKLLDLSALGADPEFVNTGMFESHSTESKFFPALMAVCSQQFESEQAKREAIVSVTLANNNLPNVKSVLDLGYTLPDIKNLDLSNNEMKNLEALDPWRRRFQSLQHLVLAGNPLENSNPNYQQEVMGWYPSLRMLNNVQVRTDDEVALAKKVFPIPVKGPVFKDESGIGENFIKHFFPAYDSDRASLVNAFYDANSKFSLSVNTSAPRAKDHQPAGWDNYIKKSRNLRKLTHLSARMSREYQGAERIREAWASLPATRHPALDSDKWCIECHATSGLPGASGSNGNNLNGLILIIHGEFHEVDTSSGQTTTQRSFDRTFVLGPGAGLGGIRVVNDIMVVRAYGGNEAWKPNSEAPAPAAPPLAVAAPPPPSTELSVSKLPSNEVNGLNLPDGFGVAGVGKTPEQAQKELLALELTKATRLTLDYSVMCLEQVNWSLESAGAAFEEVKATLPPEAFIA